jgi:hypothetical protein
MKTVKIKKILYINCILYKNLGEKCHYSVVVTGYPSPAYSTNVLQQCALMTAVWSNENPLPGFQFYFGFVIVAAEDSVLG